ncbi:multicopper oxidase family protein [Natronosporangium hydrolyticum]|uniref:Multicopper oxidase family protein n=1 Tax=Natronosporangium hydrolyticum TaxID=2811111 RepID=A0A895YFH8_9ACTN|nr:multicopper oxidase family protein [Natronosporangium hydrolyticum]QSB14209.1 multicopper oxidase family protein [Natronosporangium hydrolyticum]
MVFLLAMPLALLGSAAAGRLPATATAAAGQRRGLLRLRSRWLAVGGALVVVVTGSVALVASAASAQVQPFQQQLYIPPVLQGPEVTLEMVEADVQLLPTGPPTRMWTYNGNFPGPTIRRPAGEPTQLAVRNRLPATFGEATLHNHGGHSASSEDGQADSFLIPSGGMRTYTYEHMERGEPERAAMQWYHDHRMDLTGRNVWNGLAGLFILDDEVEAALDLPSGEFDIPLVLADRSFDEQNQIPYVFNPLGTVGDTILVNGRPQPHFNVGDRKYRLRLLNASNRLPYAVELSNGQPMHQIATESGLLPAPVERHQIVLGPGERVEVVIDFAGHLGEEIVLRAVGGGGGMVVGGDVLQFRVDRDLIDDSALPATLRPIPDFGEVSVTREFSLDFADDMWTINGLPFDPERFDAEPALDSTERWIFTNNTEQSHTIHIHDVDWLLEHRDGQPPPAWENALKETWFIEPNETISLITTFTGHTGAYVFHCHMLEHEDMMMMAQFNVLPGTERSRGEYDHRQPPNLR